MAKQLNVSLAFTADTSKAKQQLQDLQRTLSEVVKTPSTSFGTTLTKDIQEARNAAMDLQAKLQQATSIDTGKLDLTKLRTSIEQSGMSLEQYRQKLSALGPDGQKAFAQVANAIVKAEMPMKRSNRLLTEFKTTLFNTARWQISSSILHGFIGAISSAYGYAKDLNKSLNNIRVVTGYNTDEMAKFAVQANKAAQALSTTTTDYTNASLIYYQQGIRDESEIAARTETTIKLANVSRQSAEDVSSQMTAIWNNFDDGTKSLEYYADAITALGASTASSSEEIATGLEKFAAVSKTVGLSYEYATAALATVVAQTRQSADTVGTAFRTIFSRLEGLKLGETLEDGVDLNKYSAALKTIGVDILDASGNMKQMDDILDETAAHWDSLNQSQKMAFAETVGGVRQYTNLIALMDNWDQMQENISTAKNSSGTLQEQADIYAESWEAAQDRVKAAAEKIYDDLISDEFFVTMLNGIQKILGFVDNLIESLGGLKGVLSTVSTIVLNVFSKDIANNISRIAQNLAITKNVGANIDFKKEAATQMGASSDLGGLGGEAQAAYGEGRREVSEAYIESSKYLTEEEQKRLQLELDFNEAFGQSVVKAGEAADQAERELAQRTKIAALKYPDIAGKQNAAFQEIVNMHKTLGQVNTQAKTLSNTFQQGVKPNAKAVTETINELKSRIGEAGSDTRRNFCEALKLSGQEGRQLYEHIQKVEQLVGTMGTDADGMIDLTQDSEELQQIQQALDYIQQKFGSVQQASTDAIFDSEGTQAAKNEMYALADGAYSAGEQMEQSRQKIVEYGISSEKTAEQIKKVGQTQKTFTDLGKTITASAQMISATTMAINTLSGAIDTIKDPDMSGWEKFVSVLGSVAMVVPMLVMSFNAFKATQLGSMIVAKAHTLVTIMQTIAQHGLNAAMEANPVGAVIAAFVALIAITVALVAIFVKLIDTESKQEKAAKQAEQAAKNLAEAYNESKQAYEDLKNSISQYDKAKSAIEDMTRGTQEWKDAIIDANDKALQLIDTLKLTSDAYTINSDGLIEFKDGVLEAAQAEQADQTAMLQSASIMANANAKNARAAADVQQLKEDNHMSYGAATAIGAAGGAALGSVVPALGTAAGALLGAAAGLATAGINNAISDQRIEDAINRLTEGDLADQFVKGMSDEQLMSELDINDAELLASIKDLATTINNNTEAQHASAQIAAQTALQNNQKVQNSEYKDEIAQAAGRIYEQSYYDEDTYNKYLEDAKSRGWFNTGNAASEEAMAKYAEAMGLNDLKKYEVTNYKGDGTVEYKYIDDNGEEQKKIVTAEEIAATLAAADAAKELEGAAENLVKVFRDLDQSGQAYDQAMKDFLASGDLEGSANGEFAALQEQVNQAGGAEAYLSAKFGGEDGVLSDEEAKMYGYESAAAFAEAFQAELDETQVAWDELDLSDVNLTGIDNISLKTGQALREMLDDIKLGPLGEEAGNKFVDGLNKMLEGLDTEDQQAALNSLMQIDWSDWDAMDQARAILAEYNQELDMSDPYWQTFIDDMRTANLAQPDFTKLKNTLSEISSILSNLDFGKTIKDDDYRKLVAYNSEWAKFFATQADGTHQFIGDQNEMLEIMRNNITEEKAELEERARLSETLDNAGWHTIDSEGNNTGAIDFTNAESLKGLSLESLMTKGDTFKNVVADLGYDIEEVMEWAADPERYREQIDHLYEGIADYMSSDYDALSEEMDEMMASTATDLYDLFQMRGAISEEAIHKQAEVMKQEMISSAQTLAELDAALSTLKLFEGNDVTVNLYEQAQALLGLASSYENATQEAQAYNQVLANLETYSNTGRLTEASKKALEEATDNLRAAILAGEAANKYSLDAKVIEKQAKAIRALNSDLQMSAEQATKLAIANQRMNKGVKALNEGFKDWRKTLKTADKTSEDYAEAVVNIEDAVRDLVAATDDWELPDGFLDAPENLELIGKAAEGDELAINQLGNKLAQAGIEALEFNEGLATAYNEAFGADLDLAGFESAKEVVLRGIQDIYDNLEALNDGTMSLDEAMSMSGESWVASLNEMALATGMSVDQMNNTLNQLGVQAKVETVSVPQEIEVPTYDEYSQMVESGNTTASYKTPDGETVSYEIPKYHRRTWSVPGPTIKTQGYTQVAQISTVDGATPPPAISFTGVGGTANKGGSNRGGGVSPSSTGGGKSGGGGGGGSKNKETKEKKNASDEIERYHKINQQIERQSEQLDRLGKAKDRAFGPQKQKLFKEELQNLANISDMYREHMRQSSEWLEKDKAVMEKYGANISETDGTILNYAALMQQQIDIYNKAVDAYNNSAQDDADKERLKAAEEAYKQFTDDLKQYEETVKQHQEDIANYVDSMIQRYDTMKEKTQEAIEFRLEFDDNVIDQLDRMIDRLDTWNASMYNSVDIMEKLNQKTGALIDKNNDLETGMKETLEHFLMDYKEFDENGKVSYQTGLSKEQSDEFIKRFENNQLTQADIEMLAHMPEEERQALMDYADQRQENTDALIESAQAVVDNIKNQFDKSVEEMENAAKPIERARAALDNYSSIIEIVGQDYLGITDEYMQEFRQQSWNVLHNQTMALKAQKESLEQQRIAIMEAMENAPPEMAEMYRNMLKDVDDEIASKTDEWYSSWQEELSRARENFAATVDSIKNNLLDAFAGPNNTWVQMQQSLEFAKEKADEMVPEYKQIYELSKLNRDINKSIDDTDNIKNKKALRDLQKEINKLSEEGVQVSQYDLDNARRKYELELARLQLEESQNVKDTVRLNKDSEGNWSYIYTADEEDVAAAEQNYEDKLYAMQEANAQYINELQDNIISLEEQYAEKIAEIMNDQTLTDEQRNAMIEALDERFQERMAFLTGELEKTVENNKDLYDNDWAWYAEYTERQNAANEGMTEYNREQQGYRLGDEEEFVTSFNDTILGMQTGYGDFNAFQDGMTNAAEEAKNAMIQAYKEELEPNITTSMEDAGTSVDGFAEDMQEQVDTVIVPEAQAAQEAVEEMGTEAVNVMNELIDQAETWATKYGEIMQAIIDKNDLVIESINKVNGALSQLQEDQIGHDDTEGEGVEGGQGNGENGGSDNGGGNGEGTSTREFNDTVARKIAADIWVWGGQRSGWYNNPTRKQRLTEKFGSSGAALVQGIINRDAEAGRLTYAFDWNDLKNYHYDKFDTGGYTGDWAGEDGRMAMLHQKELVLDETDTRNLLSAVEIVRSISKLIDLSAQASEFAIGNLNAASAASIGMGQLEQSVTITAEFPNATDRNEIAEAFNTLINQASQYANRKI